VKPVYAKSMAALAAVVLAILSGGGSALGASADVGITVTDGAATAIPGTSVTYSITVTNNGTSNVKSGVVDDAFPSTITGVTWTCAPGAGAACTASGTGAIHQSVNLPAGSSVVFTATGTIDHAAFPTLTNTATASTGKGSTDPTPADNTATDVDSLTPVADLAFDSATVTPSLVFGNNTASQNTLVYAASFHNIGPSDARHATLRFSPALSALLGDADWCRVTANVTCGPNSHFTTYDQSTGIDAGQLAPAVSASFVIRAHALASNRDGALTVSQPLELSVPAPTTDPVSTNNSASTSSVEIDTVSSPVQNVQALPGNGNVIITWQPPANDGGQDITQYRVTVTPAGGGSPIIVPIDAAQVLCPNGVSSDCYRLNVTPLTNNTTYTFAVQALNAVGYSDPAQVVATPSTNASSHIVAASTTTVFSTCTTATAQQPTCVQYQIPSGGGGVFGTQGGSAVSLPASFCGGAPCITNTGAQNSGALAGYDDPTSPLVEVVTWDSTTLAPDLPLRPVCSTNSTATDCFPNNLPIFYEMSFTLLNFPLEASTELNLPGNTHFCADPVSQGGAGNALFARPKPAVGGLPQFNGYSDSAGSACISSVSVLTGLPGRPNQKGDVQVVINLTSDSDALAGHH
jgi:uncharacterized repeat protein (TIGR01451 family)